MRTVQKNSVFGCHGVSYGTPERAVCIRNISDYSPFGVSLDGRTIQDNFYRHGFNGMEKDDEVKGGGNSYDFGARMYDSRVGRWWSVDPLAKKYPDLNPYCFIDNSPLRFVDPNGKEIDLPKGKNYGEDVATSVINNIHLELKTKADFKGKMINFDYKIVAHDLAPDRLILTFQTQRDYKRALRYVDMYSGSKNESKRNLAAFYNRVLDKSEAPLKLDLNDIKYYKNIVTNEKYQEKQDATWYGQIMTDVKNIADKKLEWRESIGSNYFLKVLKVRIKNIFLEKNLEKKVEKNFEKGNYLKD